MATLTADTRLPFELASKIMDYVDISELVCLSHVCSVWRRAAHAHPVFWRDIELVMTKSPPLDLFKARLCAHVLAINLEVVCFSYTSSRSDEKHGEQFRSIVLPSVGENLFRTKKLRVGCTDNLVPHIFHSLVQPASILQELHLTNYQKDWTVVTLPENFLGGFAPALTKAYLMCFSLPSHHPITAFQNIEWLYFHADREFALPDILVNFPALKHLQIATFECIEAHERMVFAHYPLTNLDVNVRDGSYTPFFSAFHPSDLAAITHIACPAYGAHGWIATLLGVIKGPLTLTIRDFGTHDVSVELSSSDPAQKRTRTFHIDQSLVQGQEDEEWWQIQEELFTPELLARVSVFRLLSKNVGIVPEIGEELPACETLELCFDGFSYRNHPLVARLNDNGLREPYALQFPAVKTIICTAIHGVLFPVTVPILADKLSALLARVISARPSPLEVIELGDVQLTGDLTALEREYGCQVRQRNM